MMPITKGKITSFFIGLLLLIFITFLVVSLGIGRGIYEINDGAQLSRVIDDTRLDGHNLLLHAIQGDKEIDKGSDDNDESDYGR